MSGLVPLLLGVHLLAAALTLVAGHRSERAGRAVAVGGSALALVPTVVLAVVHLGDAAPLTRLLASTSAGAEGAGAVPAIGFAVHVDPLAAVLLLLAGTVALLVQVYSLGYLADDPRYPSYAALVAVFTAAMSTVVVADDLWMLLVGWEVMGACSYFLIAHHWELAEARAGAVKAFLVTRTADLGLLFAVLILGERFGTYRISEVLAAIAEQAPPRDALVLPALLLVVAVAGKSAQVPFHTWLPDAMPGPTPISALIHAATMVAAGVFLVARLYPVFLSSPSALTLLAVVAAATMLLGALSALVTDDLKRVLAWSTVSQLGYMFGALALGAWSAGVLHLLAHGAFKALLFLGAGAVVHAVGSTSMHRMGGLRRRLPHTFLALTLGFAALAGVVPLVGFFTKDAVVAGAVEGVIHGRLVWPWVGWVLVASMVVTAAVTVAYAMRAWLLVFFGPSAQEAGGVHEPPWTMRAPLYALMVPTLLGGLVVLDPAALLGAARDEDLVHGAASVALTVLVLATAVLVLAVRRRRDRRGRRPRPARPAWSRAAVPHPSVDLVWQQAVVRPVLGLSRVVRAGERDVVDAYADGAAASARGLGRLLRAGQTGNVQTYLVVLVLGVLGVAAIAGLTGLAATSGAVP